MKLLHLSNAFYPQVTAGTEIFIHQLIEAQQAISLSPTVRWAAHRPQSPEGSSAAMALTPHQVLLPPVPSSNRHEDVSSTASAIPGFADLLDSFEPEHLHLHSLSPACGLAHVRAANARSIPVLVTVHAPGFTCMQGSLLYHRRSLCDGVIRDRRCTECRLVNGGLPAPLAELVALQSGWPLSAEQDGRVPHVLTSRQLTRAFRLGWEELVERVAGFHVLAEWSRQVLLGNGVPEHKLHLIRTAGPPPLPPPTRRRMQDGVLRLVYWGRCAEVKGLHLVIDAIGDLPRELPIELSFFGPHWDDAYGRRMQQKISGDPRFRLMGTLNKEQLLLNLQAYDMAVVPSTWMETGPLTVLEALAVGLPVLGSDIGGIRELLESHGGGELLPMKTEAWRACLFRLLKDPDSWPPRPTTPTRTFAMLAEDLVRLVNP